MIDVRVPAPYPWRQPDAETEDYPGLVVHDGRQTGSITAGYSRLPLWAFAGIVATHGWEEAEAWEPGQYGWTAEKHDEFIYNLLEARGEFGRLLCILADVERDEQERTDEKLPEGIVEISPWKPEGDGIVHLPPAWWQYEPSRTRVVTQLRRCLDALEVSS